MGKILLIKNADFSDVALDRVIIDDYDVDIDISDEFTWTEGYAIIGDNTHKDVGLLVRDDNDPNYDLFIASDYVDISVFETLTITAMTRKNSTATIGLCFYSDSKTVISGINYANDTNGYKLVEIEVPEGAKYIRTSFYIAEKENFSCIGHYNTNN